jgi:hypothetical protein
MNVLERYVTAMDNNDLEAIVGCWEDDADVIFNDVSAKLLTGTPGYLVGKDAIRATFTQMFAAKPKAKIIWMSEDGKRMHYDIEIVGITLPCIGTIDQERNGNFVVYSCTPRE